MKRIQAYMSGLLACGVVMFMAPIVNAQSAVQQGSAKVVNLKGSARFMSGDTTWHPLKVGAILKPGTVLQTASGSYVDLVLNNEKAKEAGTASVTTESSSSSASAMNAAHNARPV